MVETALEPLQILVRKISGKSGVFELRIDGSVSPWWLVLPKNLEEDQTEFLVTGREVLEREHGTLPILEQMSLALSAMQVPAGALVYIQGSTVFVVSRDVNLFLLRDEAVVSLHAGEEEDRLSGWIRPGDQLVIVQGWSPPELMNSTGDFYTHLRTAIAGMHVGGGWLKVLGEMTSDTVVLPEDDSFSDEKNETETLPPASVRNEKVVTAVPQEMTQPAEPRRKMSQIFLEWLAGVVQWLPQDETIFVLEDRLASPRAMRSRRLVVLCALILLCGFLGTVVWGLRARKQNVFDVQFGNLISEARYKLSESINLAELNPLRSTDLLGEVDGLIAELEKRGLDIEQLDYLRAQLQQARGLTMKKYEVSPTLWLSFNLIRENISVRDADLIGSRLGILDAVESRLIVVDTESKSPQVVAGQKEIGTASHMALLAQDEIVLSEKGLLSIKDAEQKVLQTADSWGQIKDVDIFGQGAYVLSATGIWKIPLSAAEASGGAEQWLDMEHVTQWELPEAMTIDGMVWLAYPQKVQKWVRGVEERFEVTGLPDPWVEIGDIFTAEDLPMLYVLDKGAKRVVVIDKATGEYRAQYRWDRLNELVSLLVSADGKVMWWVMPEAVYTIEVKN